MSDSSGSERPSDGVQASDASLVSRHLAARLFRHFSLCLAAFILIY